MSPPEAPERARLKAESPQRRRRRRRRMLRRVLLGTLAALVVVGGATAWLAVDALRARDALEQAAEAIPGLEQRLREDPVAVAQELEVVQERAALAARSTQGPMWWVASRLPVVGGNVSAFQHIAAVVDDLAQDVLPRVSTVAQAITPESLAPSGGRINLLPLIGAKDDVVAAHAAITEGIRLMGDLPREGLIPQIEDAASTLYSQLVELRGTSATAARAAELLPPMLGAAGPREWLVLAQNNAEQRATGGIPGAVLLLRADDGAVTFEDKASTTDFGTFETPVARMDAAEEALFGPDLVHWIQNVNLTPDFPRSGQLAIYGWQTLERDSNPTGVLSIDPVALALLLEATGPVTFEDPEGEEITLSAETAASFLLADIYALYEEPAEQDAVFAIAAETIFGRLMDADVDAGRALDALVEAANQGRLMVWSSVADEQALLAGSVLSGELRGAVPHADGTVSPQVGVFLNLTISGKQGYFLDTQAVVEDAYTRPDGSQEFEVRVTLTSRLEPDQVAYLPAYVIATGPEDGSIRSNLLVYAPEGGAVLGATGRNGQPVPLFAQEHGGLPVTVHTAVIAPGETHEYVFSIRSGPGQSAEPMLRVTPGARELPAV